VYLTFKLPKKICNFFTTQLQRKQSKPAKSNLNDVFNNKKKTKKPKAREAKLGEHNNNKRDNNKN